MRRTLVSLTGCAAVALASAASAGAATSHASAHKPLVMKEVGMRLSVFANRYEDVYRIKSSPFGEGTTIRDATLSGTTFPATAKDTAISYFKDGRSIAAETLTLGAPHVNGVGTISGDGQCTGGTFKHQGETCTYKIKGSYDLLTGKSYITVAGTYTPGATKKKK